MQPTVQPNEVRKKDNMAEPLENEEVIEEQLPVDPEEETTEEVVEEVQEEEAEEVAEEVEEEAAEPMSRRKSLRIQGLIAKLQEKEPIPASQAKGIDYKSALDADEEVLTKLEEDRTSYGDTRYNEGREEAKSFRFTTRLEIDAPKVEAEYPILSPKSPTFNPVVASAVNEWYLSTVGYDAKTGKVGNANLRYSDFVESLMELTDEMGSDKVTKSTKNITKQAAKTGMRPDGSTPKRLNLNQAPGDMNDAELDAFIAQTIPSKTKR